MTDSGSNSRVPACECQPSPYLKPVDKLPRADTTRLPACVPKEVNQAVVGALKHVLSTYRATLYFIYVTLPCPNALVYAMATNYTLHAGRISAELRLQISMSCSSGSERNY